MKLDAWDRIELRAAAWFVGALVLVTATGSVATAWPGVATLTVFAVACVAAAVAMPTAYRRACREIERQREEVAG